MILKTSLLTFCLFLLIGCQKPESKSEIDIKKEIAELRTDSDKEIYLDSIFKLDQGIRNGEGSEILLKHGEHSEELKDFRNKMDSLDRLNLQRIDTYLKQFGYPDKNSFSETATLTPWLIVHHSSKIETRKKYFTILEEAYENGNLDVDQFELYLGRTYHMKNGTYPRSEGAYKSENKITWLIKELGLDSKTNP